jgi:hypothetical protein
MRDFDTSGIAQAAPLLRKDVGLVLAVARAKGAAEPTALLDLAQSTLAALEGAGGR